MATFSQAGLEDEGFRGWAPLATLDMANVPTTPGVYVVYRVPSSEPEFLVASKAGRFKGRDPSTDLSGLRSKWVTGANAVYIGKATHLRRRLRQYVNGQVKVPAGGQQKSPPLGRDQGLFGFGRPPFARASFMRNDSPSVITTTAWCSSRSSRLTAVVCSGRKRPQSSNGQCDPMPRDRRS